MCSGTLYTSWHIYESGREGKAAISISLSRAAVLVKYDRESSNTWGIKKPKQPAIVKAPKMLTVHPLGEDPVTALVGRVVSVPLKDCAPCFKAIQQYKNNCIGQNCGSTVLADLLTEHGHGGRVYCVRCFTPVVDGYAMVQRRLYSGPSLDLWPGKAWKDVPIPKWVKRDPREMMTGAQWPESGDAWKEWHTAGLQFVLMSGRVASWLFSEPLTSDGTRVLKALSVRPDDLPWGIRLAGYLLAGVGGEYLLKARYLQMGYSLR